MLVDKIRQFDIPTVETILPFTNIESLVSFTRGLENAEGFVVAFEDGHKVKIKAEQYVRIHKTLERIVYDRNIVNLIVNEEIDDVIPLLPTVQVERIREFEERFWRAFLVKEETLLADRDICRQLYDNNRKRIALEYVPKLESKADASFIFKMLDGKDLRELMFEHIRKSITSNTKWDACAEWMGM